MDALAAELDALSSAVRAAAAPGLGSTVQELQEHVRRITTQLESMAAGNGGADVTAVSGGRARIDKMSAEVSGLGISALPTALRTRLREANPRQERCHDGLSAHSIVLVFLARETRALRLVRAGCGQQPLQSADGAAANGHRC
jgi:hypothetical protein